MTDVSSNDSRARYFTVKRPGDDDYDGESWARDVTDEVAALRAQLAEAQEQNRMLAARCDELARWDLVIRLVTAHAVEHDKRGCLMCDAYRGATSPARCSDEDCRAPLRDGKTNHAVGCRAEQDEVAG